MSRPGGDLVSLALRSPEMLAGWSLPEWDRLIRQARRANLLAHLSVVLDSRALLASVPAAPRAHLDAARVAAQAQQEAVRREVRQIGQALAPTGTDIVLLKGAAYTLAGMPSASGRLFSDVDILVPKQTLPAVEAALMMDGWATTHHDPYDQRYYRRWMHELPPLRHVKRLTVLDVHHAILPDTARLRPASAKLLSASHAIAGEARLRVLAPMDMILHSATHLFHNDELSNGLRDLVDLDGLLRHFATTAEFWPALLDRAAELDLARPLYYGLRYTGLTLGTPVPPAVLARAEDGAPPRWLRAVMDALWLGALRPDHPTAAMRHTALARHLLYLRAHWLRMPPLLLAYHLSVKAMRRSRREA